ncbi:MAG: SDR family oxidoreductase [Ruminococcaceae bacterium]|nr:SDR family oxidoreductase [Oscillospiraceae bacterium]
MTMDFNGQVAIVTGAARGVGRATAHLFAQKGAKLGLLDVDFEKLKSVKDELEEYGTEVLIYKCDVSDEKRVNEVMSDIIEKFARADILVNNAALFRSWCPFLESDIAEWKQYFDINVMGVAYCTRAVLPKMLEKGYGRVINIGSVAGVYGNANMVHYSATKGAVIAMTKALAKEVADKGVTVNCISPGSISPSDHDDMDYVQPSELAFMNRTGSDRENAELICFIASREASYISAQNIQIDGCRRKQ